MITPETPPDERPAAVYYYGTCLVDLFYPEAGLSGIRLLEREGVRVVYPQGQTCCGQPAYNSGYSSEARAVARSQIERFSRPWPVVVPSGSCAGMMKNYYPSLFEGDPFLERAQEFAGRIHELTSFLVRVLRVRLVDRGEPARVTWHTSCHALREMGIREEPASLLAQLERVEVIPLARESECCGFGGTFAVRHPEISAAMVEDKAANVAATGAPTLLSGDGGCLLNIAGRLEATGERVRPVHIAEFLWERTRAR
ncbi:MAG: (Fe-S)-binding protein [Acidobacteriota bacterium]|nr:(Fe-S)-binding protein [Acidobacteriota bacterium]